MMDGPATFTLYGHAFCHLCDDMEAALVSLLQEIGGGRTFSVEVVDLAEDAALEEQFGERVPVLFAGGNELCHYHLDPVAVRAYLAEFR